MEDSKKNKVLEKIRKLLAKAKNPACSENEVEIFMKKAQELMLEYNVSEESIEIDPSDINKDVIVSELWKFFKFKYKNFEWELMDLLGEFYDCRIFHENSCDEASGKSKNPRLSVVGTKNNRIVVLEMYDVLSKKLLSLVDLRYSEYKEKVKKDHKNGMISLGLKPEGIDIKSLERIGVMSRKNVFAGSYLSGCISGLRQSLREQRKDTLIKIGSEKHGLMVIKMDELISLRVPEIMGKIRKVDGISKNIKIDQKAFDEGVSDGSMNHTNKLIS